MQRKNNTHRAPQHTLDDALWQRVLTAKQVQGLAWKIEKAIEAEDEARTLVEMIVRKWAELVDVTYHFPELTAVFTPDAIFRIEYAYRQSGADRDSSAAAHQVRWVLTAISNIVARHEIPIAELKRRYNDEVGRWIQSLNTLPLFDLGDGHRGGRKEPSGRKATQRELYTPKDAPLTVTSRRRRRPRNLPTVHPVRIDEWKRQQGIEDFPGGITPRPCFGAIIYQFKPKARQDGPPRVVSYQLTEGGPKKVLKPAAPSP